eukprot:11906483-Karenia_brevis.AAC.1
MASIASTKTQRQQMRIKNGTFDTLVHKFSGKGTFKWNAHVRALAQTLHSQHHDNIATWPRNHDNFQHTTDTYFVCPVGHH